MGNQSYTLPLMRKIMLLKKNPLVQAQNWNYSVACIPMLPSVI